MDVESPCRVWWDQSHEVARNDWQPDSICDLDQAKAVTRATFDLGHGAVPVLVDMRYVSKVDRPAREHFSKATAVALLVGSAVSKVVANFIIGMHRMPVPTRMFTDETAALAWLGTHRE